MNKSDLYKSNNPINFIDNSLGCYRINKEYNNYNLFEMKEIMLLEKQGVAFHKYMDSLENIIRYINNILKDNYSETKYVKSVYKDIDVEVGDYKFDIPDNLLNDFKDIINNFIIKIHVKDIRGKIYIRDVKNLSGVGYYVMNDYRNVINGKLNNAEIRVQCYSVNGRLVIKDFMNSFIHEFNHLEDDRNRLIKGKESLKDYSYRKSFKNTEDKVYSKKTINKLIGWLEYMIWDDSEFNAWITSGYSYLKSIDSKRENFAEDIKGCEVYNRYKFMKDNIHLLYELEDETIWMEIYENLFNKEIEFFDYNFEKKIERAKNVFIKRSEYKLGEFWKRLCKTAALYYDDKGDL